VVNTRGDSKIDEELGCTLSATMGGFLTLYSLHSGPSMYLSLRRLIVGGSSCLYSPPSPSPQLFYEDIHGMFFAPFPKR
jgi:hypothetical protein